MPPAPPRLRVTHGELPQGNLAEGPAGRKPAAEADSRVLFSRRKESSPSDRRAPPDRRRGTDRRNGDRRQMLALVTVERRSGMDRRQNADRRAEQRRTASERRSEESAAEHIRNALQLIEHVADSHQLDDEHRRDLDAALFRLRFALDRLEPRAGGVWGGNR